MNRPRNIEGLERAPGGRRERAAWGVLSLAAVAAIVAAVLL